MAKKKKDSEETTNKMMWLLGGAAVTAFTMYHVNKHLKEREELNRLRYAERQQSLKGDSES